MSDLLYANGPVVVTERRIEMDLCPAPPFAPYTELDQQKNWTALRDLLERIEQEGAEVEWHLGKDVGFARHFVVTVRPRA